MTTSSLRAAPDPKEREPLGGRALGATGVLLPEYCQAVGLVRAGASTTAVRLPTCGRAPVGIEAGPSCFSDRPGGYLSFGESTKCQAVPPHIGQLGGAAWEAAP